MIAVVIFLLAAVLSISTSLAQPATPVPELNCAQPAGIEAIVCADPALRERHRMINRLLPAASFNALGENSSQQANEQATWLKHRDEDQCYLPSIDQCLTISYNVRLEELAVAALFRNHPEALAALELAYPAALPLYEAIYRYATIDDTVQRTKIVATLIAPLFQKIHDSPEGATAPFDSITSAEDAAATDTKFSIFVGMAGSGSYRLTMPCEALIRRPGLILALGPLYGGARDGQLPRADCRARLPELPMLNTLVDAAGKAQVCPGGWQGTIRFSVWRHIARLVLAAQLHAPENWKAETSYVKPVDEKEQQFRRAQRPSIDGANDELTTYFIDIFKVPGDTAKEQASDVVEKIVSGIFYPCSH